MIEKEMKEFGQIVGSARNRQSEPALGIDTPAKSTELSTVSVDNVR
jgi:hypothetical protein